MLVRLDGEMLLPLLQSPGSTGVWGDVTFTTEPVDECDLLIVCNRAHQDISVRCPKGGRWLFTMEPPEGYYSYFKGGYRDYDLVLSLWGDAADFVDSGAKVLRKWGPTSWYAQRSYDEYCALSPDACGKQERISYVMSHKKKQAGHKLRHNFRDYLQRSGFDFDLFGGKDHYIADKCQALLPYKYTVAIENSSYPDYWTEKISDAFLCWTIPVYWGAPNITHYFPQEAMIRLDQDDFQGSRQRLEEAVRGDYWTRNLGALTEARNRVLNRYQFFPFFCELIREHYQPRGAAEPLVIPALRHPKEQRLSYKIKNYLGVYALKNLWRQVPWITRVGE